MAQPRAEPRILAFPAARPAAGGPYVARLQLTDFRSYAGAIIETDSRPVVLSGPNGTGKTNLLEALSFLAPGRGLRRARLAEIDRRETGVTRQVTRPWALAIRLGSSDGDGSGDCDIGTGRDAEDPARERRSLRIDGAPQRGQTGLAERVALLWLTPQMDGLFLDSRSARRRFLDRLVLAFDPGHGTRLNAYEQATAERLRLLRGSFGNGETGAWLGALEQQIAEQAVAVAAARLDLVARLARVLEAADGPFPRPALALAGEVESWLEEMPALAAEERLRDCLAQNRGLDGEAGRALIGTHRTDLAARFAASGMPAGDCSTGEQKALIIAILLGQARLMAERPGRLPVLLLDEIAAHLDESRRRALYKALLDLGVQAWLTGTERGLFAPFEERAQYFTVAGERIARN
jgi:DNA replication and repair protein RecF